MNLSSDALNAIAAAMSAIAALAALIVAGLSLRQSRQAAETSRRLSARALDDSLQRRLDPMYPELRRILGHLEDGVPREIRHVLIPFFVLYSDSYAAYRDELLNPGDWEGIAQEMAYWAQKPIAKRAWQAFRQQTWTHGFVDHVDAVLAGEPVYAELNIDAENQGILWP